MSIFYLPRYVCYNLNFNVYNLMFEIIKKRDLYSY